MKNKEQKKDSLFKSTSIVNEDEQFKNIICKIAEKQPFSGSIDKPLKCPITGKPIKAHKNHLQILYAEPSLAFLYWDITPESMVSAAKEIGPQAKLFIKLSEISRTDSTELEKVFFVESFDRTGNRFFKLEKDTQRFEISIGMKGQNNVFLPLCKAKTKYLPADGLNRPGPVKWMVPSSDSSDYEYIDANQELLKKILGPYFHDLLMRGRFATIIESSSKGLFQDISLFYPDK